MLTVILQAGGQSTRMGEDKALMPFLGLPLIQRLRDRFQILNSQILIITNQPARYGFLELPLYRDVQPGRGALGGLLTALEISSTSYVGLIAADMPFASPDLLASLLDHIQQTGVDAVLPSSNYGPEPLHGIYHRQNCLPLVRKAIQQDLWRMTAWHKHAQVITLDSGITAQAAGSQHTFVNLNTREDVIAAEKLARDQNLL